MNLTRSFFTSAAVILALVLCVGIHPAAAQATKANPQYTLGMNLLWNNGDMAAMESSFKRMKSLGITQARTDWEWRVVESKQGKYDWTALDKLVTLAKRYGVTILPIVHYAPDWAVISGSKPSGVYQMAPKREFYEAYGKFLAASIDRYGPKGNAKVAFNPILHWQVWNEPNIKEFWGPSPDSGEFVNFMQTVNKQIGTRRSSVKIVHAGISKADFEFLWQLWGKDGSYGRLFDIMAVHPYFFDPKGGVRGVTAMDADSPDYAALGLVGSPNDSGFLGKVFNLQLFMTLKGTPKPIWITEIGFMAGKANPWAISEADEVTYAREALSYINQKLTKAPFKQGTRGDIAANVQRVYWFCLDDYNFPDDTGNFGVYRMDGGLRPLSNVIKEYSPR